MSHYLREHLDAVGELPQKLRETMSSIGLLDDRVQGIAALIDADVGEVARARQRYYAQFDGSSSSNDDEGPPPRSTRAKVIFFLRRCIFTGCCWVGPLNRYIFERCCPRLVCSQCSPFKTSSTHSQSCKRKKKPGG